jgi:membrane protein YdbS with pleckstrin-like domain
MKKFFIICNILIAILIPISATSLAYSVSYLNGWKMYLPLVSYMTLVMIVTIVLAKDDMKKFIEENENKKGDE